MFCGRSQLFEDVDLITVYFDEEDLYIMETCDSRGGVWSVELKAMCLSVMRKCLCQQQHRLPYMGEVLHALMLIDMPLAGVSRKLAGLLSLVRSLSPAAPSVSTRRRGRTGWTAAPPARHYRTRHLQQLLPPRGVDSVRP